MKDLDITNNFYSLKMELVEIDENLPSFKMQVDVSIFHPTGLYKYSANDLWFECNIWDDFTGQFKNVTFNQDVNQTLNDMNELFRINYQSKKGTNILSFAFTEKYAKIVTDLRFSQLLDEESYSMFKNAFIDFNKWW